MFFTKGPFIYYVSTFFLSTATFSQTFSAFFFFFMYWKFQTTACKFRQNVMSKKNLLWFNKKKSFCENFGQIKLCAIQYTSAYVIYEWYLKSWENIASNTSLFRANMNLWQQKALSPTSKTRSVYFISSKKLLLLISSKNIVI